MKGLNRIGLLLFMLGFALFANAQNETQRASVIRIEGSAGQVAGRADVEMPPAGSQNVVVADGFSYYTTSGGIFLILPRPNNNVRLFALTGQLLWSGELVSGRFYIPTKSGIYFLRVNNKSYKVSCK
jgi:hypothetical protein